MCKLLKDNQIINFLTRQELEDYLNFRKIHDKWFVSPIQSMKIIAGTGTPENFKATTKTLVPLDGIKECFEEGTNLFLEFYIDVNGQQKRGVIPVRDTAINSILARARLGGFSLVNNEEEPGVAVLDDSIKAQIITDCLKLYTAQAKVLYRDEEISAVHSGQYAVLTESDIIASFEETMKKDFSDLEFISADVSHRYFKANYDLHCEEVEEDIQMMLSEIGENADSVKVKVTVFSSDIGTAAVHILTYIDVDGMSIVFGKPKAIKHIGKRTADDIKKEVGKLLSLFKACPEDFKRLGEIQIHNPGGCLRSIAKEMHLPKKLTLDIASVLDDTKPECTAYEIYWHLNEIGAAAEKNITDGFRIMAIKETIAECLKIDFKKFDRDFLWARGEKEEE